MTPKRFCLLTTGRTGSTSLMNALAAWDDVMVPNKLFVCPDNELVHPENIQRYITEFSRIVRSPVRNGEDLIERFFEWGSNSPYTGFKSMPNRHGNYRDFITRSDIKFIVLTRDDIVATIASFMIAMRTGSWRREGGRQESKWTFRPEDRQRVLGNLSYVRSSRSMLCAVPDAIRLCYEELCDPSFNCPELNGFFDRPIRIKDPKPPVNAAEYVTNWPEFSEFVRAALTRAQQPST